jgi:hypothetical protein
MPSSASLRLPLFSALLVLASGLYSQLILSEDFDAGLGPWTESGGGASGWFSGVDVDLFGASGSIDGTNMAIVDDDENGSADPPVTTLLTSPAVDLTAFTAVRLQFDYNFRSSCLTESFAVEVFDGSAWVQVFLVNTDDCGAWTCAPLGAYPQADIDVTPYLNAAFQIRLVYDDGGGCWGWWAAVDNVRLFQPSADDLRTTELVAPLSGCGLGAAEPVVARFENNGSAPQSGFPVAFAVDGGAPSVETFAGTLLPGESSLYTFTASADLSGPGPHEVQVWTDLPADGFPDNDTISATVATIPGIVAPYLETFDASTFSTPTGWINDPSDGTFADWFFQDGAVFIAGTGPDADHTSGFGFYAYVDDFTDEEQINLLTPCVDVSGLVSPFLRFWVHSREANDGADPSLVNELHVDIQSGGVWTLDAIPPIGTQANAWEEVEMDLAPFGTDLRVRFRANTDNGAFEHWIAIDDVEFFDKPPVDVGVAELINPGASCGLTASEIITVELQNFGTLDQSGFNVSVIVDGGPVLTEPFPLVLAAGSSLPYSFSVPADLSALGPHTITAWTDLAGDLGPANDTLDIVLENIPVIASFPYTEDFESGSGGWTLEAIAASTWALGTPSGAVIGSPPPSTPSSTNSWVTNLSGSYVDNESGSVVSPCFDFTSLSGPEIVFDAWWDSESGFDGAQLESSTDGGTTWSLVGSFGSTTADNWYTSNSIFGLDTYSDQAGWTNATFGSGGSGGWVRAREDVFALAGESDVRFRFNFGSDGSVTGFDGFAFDNLQIRNKPLNDLGVLSIEGPNDGCGLGAAETIPVKLINGGLNDQVNFDVNYRLDGGPVTTETVVDTLFGLSTSLYFFSTPADFSAEGPYIVEAWTSLPLDEDPSNDTTASTVTHVPSVSSFPYTEDFETPAHGWTVEGFNPSWERATPAGPVINSSTGVGNQCFITDANGSYNADEDSWILSPCFDFSTLSNPAIAFDLWWELQGATLFGGISDGAVLQVSTNDGFSWNRVGEAGDPDNWYNYSNILANPGSQPPPNAGWSGLVASGDGSGGWVKAIHPLADLAGEPVVRFRLAVADDGFDQFDGLAFDNIVIKDAPSPNLGADLVFCAGESVILDAGVVGDSYLWSTGDTTATLAVSSSGVYWVQVSDAIGISGTDTIVVDVVPAPVVDLGPDATVCAGTVLDAGLSGFDYLWNNGSMDQSIVVEASGTYEVLVLDPVLGCSGSDAVELVVQQEPDADFIWTAGGAWLNFIDVSPFAESWLWDFGDGTTSTDQDPSHYFVVSGTYTVSLTVSNACGSSTITQSIDVVANALPSAANLPTLSVHPTPSQGRVRLSGESPQSGVLEVQIQDLEGKTRWSGQAPLSAGAFRVPLDLEFLPAGVYLVESSLVSGNDRLPFRLARLMIE